MKLRSVFICYALAHTMVYKQYSAALRKRGLAIMHDQTRQQDTSAIPKEVGWDLQICGIFILILSQLSASSYRNRLLANAYGELTKQDPLRRLIIVCIDPCEVPSSLRNFPCIDAFDKPLENVVDEMIALVSQNGSDAAPLSPSLLSRRVVLGASISLAGLAVVGSGAIWWSRAHNSSPSLTSPPHFLPGQTIFTYRGHVTTVHSIAWSPDSKKIASGSDDGNVKIWNAEQGSPFLTYTHTDRLTDVAWSSDNKYIASSSWDKTIQVWNTVTDVHTLTYQYHSYWVTSVAWSPDSHNIVSASIGRDTTVQIWNGITGQRIMTDFDNPVGAICVDWSPDGRFIISGGSDIRIWDTMTKRHVITYNGHADLVNSVKWSPNGKYIASASKDKTVQVWIAATGQHLLTYRGHSGIVFSLSWSPDGKQIVSGSFDKTAQMWDSRTAKLLFTYRNHRGEVFTVAWSPDGSRIASSGSDTTVQIWQAR